MTVLVKKARAVCGPHVRSFFHRALVTRLSVAKIRHISQLTDFTRAPLAAQDLGQRSGPKSSGTADSRPSSGVAGAASVSLQERGSWELHDCGADLNLCSSSPPALPCCQTRLLQGRIICVDTNLLMKIIEVAPLRGTNPPRSPQSLIARGQFRLKISLSSMGR